MSDNPDDKPPAKPTLKQHPLVIETTWARPTTLVEMGFNAMWLRDLSEVKPTEH